MSHAEIPKLYIDLETLPTTDPVVVERIESKVTPPANYSKADSIAKWEQSVKPGVVDERVSRTGLNGTYGSICVLGWAIEPGGYGDVYAASGNKTEADILRAFHSRTDEILRAEFGGYNPIWVGYNVCGFDLRYLWQRAIINRVGDLAVRIPYDAQPWQAKVVDLMHEWCGRNRDQWVSLSALAHALDIEVLDQIDGSQVATQWARGPEGQALVVEHCRSDVATTVAVHKRMAGM